MGGDRSDDLGGAYDCTTSDPTTVTVYWNGGDVMPLTRGGNRNAFTFGCDHDAAVAKCVTAGYKPWVSTAMANLHQSCVRMMRADYCGDGTSHTIPGTPIDVMDYLGIENADPTDRSGQASYGPEAEWGPSGAVCVTSPRYTYSSPTNLSSTVTTLSYINATCPRVLSTSCNANYTSIRNGTPTSLGDFWVGSSGVPVSYLQDFSSTITTTYPYQPIPIY